MKKLCILMILTGSLFSLLQAMDESLIARIVKFHDSNQFSHQTGYVAYQSNGLPHANAVVSTSYKYGNPAFSAFIFYPTNNISLSGTAAQTIYNKLENLYRTMTPIGESFD